MITQAQLDALNAANKEGQQAVAMLIGKWERELFTREISKGNKVAFELTNQKQNITKTVVGTRVGEHFAFHKSPWDKSGRYVLTHIATGINTLSGKKSDVSAAIKLFTAWAGRDDLARAMDTHKMQALGALSNDLVMQYRDIYFIARGRSYT